VSNTDLISSYFPKPYGEIPLLFVEGTGSGKNAYFRVLGRVTAVLQTCRVEIEEIIHFSA